MSRLTRRRSGGDDLPMTLGASAWWSARSVAQAHDTNVDSWTDLSGNGHTATPGGDWAPNYNTNAINGRPALFFTAANSENFLSIAGSLPIPASSRNYAVFAAVRTPTAFGTDMSIYAERSTLDDSGIIAQCGLKSGNVITHDVRDDADVLVRDGVATLTTSTNYVLGFAMDASVVKAGLNGVWTSGTNFTGGTITLNNASIGVSNPLGGLVGRWGDGFIADLVIINRSLTASEKLAMDRYLGQYYGIAVA